MKEMHTIQEFIEFYEAIPKQEWGVGNYSNGRQKCALPKERILAALRTDQNRNRNAV